MKHHRSAAIPLILLFALLCVNAQTQQSPSNGPREQSRTGTITGRVVNESGQPLQNVIIHLRSGGPTEPTQTTTNRDGVFKVSGVEGQSYEITAFLPAHTSKPREATDGPAPRYRVGDSVSLVLIKGGVITGTVTRPNGDPVVAINVRARMIRDPNGRSVNSNNTSYEVATDDRGVYRIYGLLPGTYIVAADGRTDHSGTGVNGFAGDAATYAPSATRETAAEISVRAGEEIRNIDIRYRGERGRTISGTVNLSPGDQHGLQVTLSSVVAGVPEWYSRLRPGSREFFFEGIPDGDYNLLAQSWSMSRERELGFSEPRTINVRGADIADIELIVLPLGTISGRVVLEETKAPECTEKRPMLFSETSISAWHRDTPEARKLPQYVWREGAPATPNAQGNLTLKNLAASQYYFAARVSAKDWYLQTITFASSTPNTKAIDATRTWTTVKAGDRLSGLTVTLAQGAASLRGQITLAEGESLPERLVVYLAPAEREKTEEVLRYYAVPVTKDQKFSMTNLAPGRYWILAQPAIAETPSPLTKLRLPDATEARSALRRAAEAAKTEIELKPCQHVTQLSVSVSLW